MPFKDKILHQEELRQYRRKHYAKNKDYYIKKTKERKHKLQYFIKKQKIGILHCWKNIA